MANEIDIERFARHIVLREIGGPGQQALARAHVAIVGAGGLGAPAALYLAAAGIGAITLIDPDTVSLDNLQPQILFRTDDVGTPKVETGARALEALNPATRIVRTSPYGRNGNRRWNSARRRAGSLQRSA